MIKCQNIRVESHIIYFHLEPTLGVTMVQFPVPQYFSLMFQIFNFVWLRWSLESKLYTFCCCTCTTCLTVSKALDWYQTHRNTFSNSFNQRSRNCPLHVAPVPKLNIHFHICTTGILHCINLSTTFSPRNHPRHEKFFQRCNITTLLLPTVPNLPHFSFPLHKSSLQNVPKRNPFYKSLGLTSFLHCVHHEVASQLNRNNQQ